MCTSLCLTAKAMHDTTNKSTERVATATYRNKAKVIETYTGNG